MRIKNLFLLAVILMLPLLLHAPVALAVAKSAGVFAMVFAYEPPTYSPAAALIGRLALGTGLIVPLVWILRDAFRKRK